MGVWFTHGGMVQCPGTLYDVYEMGIKLSTSQLESNHSISRVPADLYSLLSDDSWDRLQPSLDPERDKAIVEYK